MHGPVTRTIRVLPIVGIVKWKGNPMPRSNPKPLVICVKEHGDTILQSESLKRFTNKGHLLTTDHLEADVIIGPTCWRIDPRLRLGVDSNDEESLERQLEMMEKGIRAIKFPKEKKDGSS